MIASFYKTFLQPPEELINEIGGDDIHERESVRSSEGSH